MLQMVVFLGVAVALYWVSDRVLLAIEAHRGRRLDNRTLVFFAILLGLALVTFWGLERVLPPLD
jgi:hypothetical protein